MENYGAEENCVDFFFKRFNESNEDEVEFENSSQSEFDRGNMENYGAEENCVDFFFKRFNESNEDEVEFENSSQSEFDKWYALEDLFSSFSWGFHLSGDSPGCSDGFLNVGSEETGTDILKAVSCYEQGDRLLVGRISSCNQSAFGLNISSSNQCSNDLLDASKAAPPHAALFFTLGYLPWQELLMIQRVCRSLRDAVNEDLLLWQNICVEPPMSSKLTNEKLLKLTAKAQGSLRSLTLMECSQITDAGLQQIINNNPHIVKLQLSVPRCVPLTPDGVVETWKGLYKLGNLRYLRLRGVCNMTKEHLEGCYSLLQRNQQQKQRVLYGNGRVLGGDDDIDIEICPRCGNARQVFDCASEICREMQVPCRGCILCIPRCGECGVCIRLEDMGDTCCSDFLCWECMTSLPECMLCGRPGCHRHLGLPETLDGVTGFICESCRDFPSCFPS